MIKTLEKIANRLDAQGHTAEAYTITQVMKRLAEDETDTGYTVGYFYVPNVLLQYVPSDIDGVWNDVSNTLNQMNLTLHKATGDTAGKPVEIPSPPDMEISARPPQD